MIKIHREHRLSPTSPVRTIDAPDLCSTRSGTETHQKSTGTQFGRLSGDYPINGEFLRGVKRPAGS